jgi:RHS repeat-associated protein
MPHNSRYEAFGEKTGGTGTVDNKYLFAGEQFDEELGDYYLRARYYDTDAGRFLRRDVWEGQRSEPITLHKYIYSNANPTNYIDPSGYVSLNQGKQVHDKIEQHFISQDSISRDTEQTIRKILLRSKGYYSPRRPLNSLTPDLVDFSQRDIYEIKTTKGLLVGFGKMHLYLDTLNRQDPFWHAGSDYVPPFVIPMTGIYSGNVAIVKPPILGVVSYDIIETQKLFLATAVLGINSIQQAISNLLSTLALTKGYV